MSQAYRRPTTTKKPTPASPVPGQPTPPQQPTGTPSVSDQMYGPGGAPRTLGTAMTSGMQSVPQQTTPEDVGFQTFTEVGPKQRRALEAMQLGGQAWDIWGNSQVEGMQDRASPTDVYGGVTQPATERVGGTLRGEGLYPGPGGNAGMDYGMNLLYNAGSSAPTVPGAPNLTQAPTSYGYAGPTAQFGNMNLPGTDVGGIAGPNRRDIYDPSQTNYAGPSAGADRFAGPGVATSAAGPASIGPSYEELIAQAQGFGSAGAGIARENVGAPTASEDPLARRAFESAIAGNEALAGGAGGIDTETMRARQEEYENALLGRASRAGRIDAGGRGFGGTGQNTVADTAVAREMAPVMAQLGKEQGERELQMAQYNLGARGEALGRLTPAGTAAAGSRAEVGGLNLGAAELTGGLDVTQRGQDVDLSNTRGGQSIQALQALTGAATGLQEAETGRYGATTGRIGTAGELELGSFGKGTERGNAIGQQIIEEFNAGTARGREMGDLMLQADQLRQTGDIDSYEAMTSRIATQAGVTSDEARNMIDQFRAHTERGLGVAGVETEAGRTGLGYAELEAENVNRFNQSVLDRYGKEGGLGMEQFRAETDRLSTLLGGAGEFGDIYQRGAIEAGHQNLEAAQLGLQVLNGSADAIQQSNELYQKALAGDQQAEAQYMDMMATLWWAQKQAEASSGGGGIGGFVGSLVGGVAGAAAGPIGSAIGERAGNWIGGGGG